MQPANITQYHCRGQSQSIKYCKLVNGSLQQEHHGISELYYRCSGLVCRKFHRLINITAMVEACCITHEIDSKLLRSISITYLGLFGEKKTT